MDRLYNRFSHLVGRPRVMREVKGGVEVDVRLLV